MLHSVTVAIPVNFDAVQIQRKFCAAMFSRQSHETLSCK